MSFAGRLVRPMPAELPMSSHSDHARPNLCRNPFTRSRWSIPLLLLLASPLTRGLAVSGTLMFGTGCAELTYEDCEQWQAECMEACAPDDSTCRAVCEFDAEACFEDAYLAEQRHAERVDAISEAAVACFAVAMCTLDSIDESTSEGDGEDEWSDPEPEPEPDPNDDWGEDWGEQNPDQELELGAVSLTDLPEE
jgi:hypothetical protein